MKNILLICLFNLILIPLFGQEREVTFTDHFVKLNEGKVTIEINEVQELTHILMAISNVGLKDSNMINHKSEYYKDVVNHFSPYRNHRAVDIIDSMLNESIIYFILISSNANGFTFDGNKLIRTNIYTFPAKGVGSIEISEDPILKYRKELEDFAILSGYKRFYNNKKPYYNQVKMDYEKYGEIDKQKKWLEQKFDYKINSYRVLTSPLLGGINATTSFTDNNFKEILLYLPIIKHNNELTKELNITMNSRVIFTEIDHNYVGPLSNKYKDKIDSIFNNREFWVDSSNKSTKHYGIPIKVFDEYMTWGLFILYASEHFTENDGSINYIIDHINSKMMIKGFPKAKAFNKELLRLYKQNSNNKIETIYNNILEWSSHQR